MQFQEIENIVITIVQSASGKYLLPYQIFTRLFKIDPVLGQRIENAYPAPPGNPNMGEGAGTYYSPASFVAQSLEHFRTSGNYPLLDKRWFDSIDIEIEDIVPGNKEGTSIWAWEPR